MAINKVVIAAAGQGTRMLELSKNKSKHLIEVESRPFLAYLIDNLLLAGYRELILVVGFKNGLMNEFAKEYTAPNGIKKSDYKISVVNQCEVLGPKEKEYGTACPVKCVENQIKNENFVYLYGDNLFSVEDLKAMNIDDSFCYVAGLKHENPEKYGVLIRDGEDFLEEIIEKPKEFVGDLINAGLYKFTPEVFEKLLQIKKSARGEYEITDTISLLAKEKKVKIKEIKDFWLDFGNPEDIKKVSDFIKNGNNKTIAKSAK
jgi:NDP-sugar pyrophosphorylase family protein